MSDEYKVVLNLSYFRPLTYNEIDNLTDVVDDMMFDTDCDEYTSKNGISCNGKIRLPSGPPEAASIRKEAREYFDLLLSRISNIASKGELTAAFTNLDYPNFVFKEVF